MQKKIQVAYMQKKLAFILDALVYLQLQKLVIYT